MKGIDLFSGGGCGSAGARHAGYWPVPSTAGISPPHLRRQFLLCQSGQRATHRNTGAGIFGGSAKVDMLIASPECTHHSIARGNRPVDRKA